jgi:hypothetical protein
MATYYVRTDGSNANTGLGSTTATAWQTITYALANMTLTTGTNYLYIAPGVYRESPTLTVTPSSTQTLVISGDPTATQFAGVTANQVRVTGAASDSVRSSPGTRFTLGNKTYVTVQNLVIEVLTGGFYMGINTTGNNITIEDCVIYGIYTGGSNGAAINCEPNISTLSNMNIRNNILCGFSTAMYVTCFGGTSISGINVSNNRFISNLYHIYQQGTPSIIISNNVFIGGSWGVYITAGNTTNLHLIQNNIIGSVETGIRSGNTGWQVQRNNIINAVTDLTNVSSAASTITSDFLGVDFGQALLQGFGSLAPFGTILDSRNTAFGVATSAPVTDAYNVAWTGATPDAGAVTYRSLSSANPYEPTERNASTITIAPGSTSQSIELYLGVVGLTSSTSNLSARYNRTRTASVSIPLVARTIAQAWTSGGFAEVDSTNMPGVYRLDVPDAALAAGADDVTIVVRGASGTNGAVMTVKLSSGGLTAAQTAAAVLDAVGSSYVTAGSIGYSIQNSNVASISGSTAAASELSGALLHNGTDYIDSNLLGGASTRVFVGTFDLRQTGSETVDTIEVFTTDTPSFELQLTDGDGNSVPVTGATLGLRILDVASTVVETGTPTVEYGTGGIVRWTGPGTYLAIGCPVGNYRLFIDRTVSGTTTTFGPLQIRVQAQ